MAGRLVFGMSMGMVALLSPGWARALHFDFRPPAGASDPAAPAIMRDLAERVIPVYQDADADRYLANLSALQLVAGDYDTAYASRQSLQEHRRKANLERPVDRGLIYDIYASAKFAQSDHHTPFASAFTTAFNEVIARLDDRNAFAAAQWLIADPRGPRDALQKLFDKERSKDRLEEDEAVALVWTYMSFEAYRDSGPLIPALVQADEAQRYSVEDDISIPMADGRRMTAMLVRPRRLASSAAALLEIAPSDDSRDAMECAAHGYIGVVAHPATLPGKHRPLEHEGEDTRLVIAWIAAQPWSDGRVGMYGEGYGALMPWAAAKHLPPALKAIATSTAWVPGIDMPMQGGIFHNSAYRWSFAQTHPKVAEAGRFADEAQGRSLDEKWYRSGKRYRDLGQIYGRHNSTFIRWLNHPSYDRYWQKLIPYRMDFARLDIPVLTITGYYSASEPGDLYLFTQHHKFNPRADHTLLVGPYEEGSMRRFAPGSRRSESPDSSAQIDLHEVRFQWFDHVLNGVEAPSVIKAQVNYLTMGADRWQHAASIGAMGPATLHWFLDAGASETLHRLTPDKQESQSHVALTVQLAERGDAASAAAPEINGQGLVMRDNLVFMSDTLRSPLELGGLWSARLDLIVNKMDLDLNIALYELRPNGRYIRLYGPADELRASYARDRLHRHLLRAGERQFLSVTSERLMSRQAQTGSRLVLSIGVNKKPDREINYGTGNDVSEESIADGKEPLKIELFNDSYVDLPIKAAP